VLAVAKRNKTIQENASKGSYILSIHASNYFEYSLLLKKKSKQVPKSKSCKWEKLKKFFSLFIVRLNEKK
jgi:hypothetical protein